MDRKRNNKRSRPSNSPKGDIGPPVLERSCYILIMASFLFVLAHTSESVPVTDHQEHPKFAAVTKREMIFLGKVILY